MTLTKEWLLKTIAELEEERDAVPGVVNVDAAMALAAMKIALASLEAKDKIPELRQVIYHFRDWNEGFPIDRFKADYVISWMLANYPPAQPTAVSVPDEEQCKPHPVMAVKGELGFLDHFDRIISERDEDIDIGQLGSSNYEALMLAALDAFRDAMLQGAEPVQGWIPCSERMPEEYDFDIWVFSLSKGVHDGVQWDGEVFADDEYQFKISDASHWMKKIYPEAPQQEA
ncbi:DUF551 domain-containing protein [Enterobacter hormaechei]